MSDLLQMLFGNRWRPDFHSYRECGCFHDSVEFGKACRPGFVYIVQFGDLYKIGATNGKKGIASLKSRINAVNKQRGEKGRTIGYIETNCAQGLERWMHYEYRKQRVHTEFFRLTETDLNAIRAMNQFNGGTLVFRSFS